MYSSPPGPMYGQTPPTPHQGSTSSIKFNIKNLAPPVLNAAIAFCIVTPDANGASMFFIAVYCHIF